MLLIVLCVILFFSSSSSHSFSFSSFDSQPYIFSVFNFFLLCCCCFGFYLTFMIILRNWMHIKCSIVLKVLFRRRKKNNDSMNKRASLIYHRREVQRVVENGDACYCTVLTWSHICIWDIFFYNFSIWIKCMVFVYVNILSVHGFLFSDFESQKLSAYAIPTWR